MRLSIKICLIVLAAYFAAAVYGEVQYRVALALDVTPAYHVVKELFGKEWRTGFERDVGGKFSFRGFKGAYELEATANGKTVRSTFRIHPAAPGRIEVAFADSPCRATP